MRRRLKGLRLKKVVGNGGQYALRDAILLAKNDVPIEGDFDEMMETCRDFGWRLALAGARGPSHVVDAPVSGGEGPHP